MFAAKGFRAALMSTVVLAATGAVCAQTADPAQQPQPRKTGNVIFFHPDGTSLNNWNALRLLQAGPDGELNWDKLPAMAVYKGHLLDGLTATSHGGGTAHAFGIKVKADSFGMNGTEDIKSASDKPMSILKEAKEAGKAVGLIQSGHIAEPGTAVFAASVPSRRAYCEIARQVMASGADVIMSGGERFMLPIGVQGRHGQGECIENLIEKAKADGYTIVYTKDELEKLAAGGFEGVTKLLGVFAHSHTFNDNTEEENAERKLPDYDPQAPTIADMGKASLAVLSRSPNGFLLIAEEEGTDNMANKNNAKGTFEALRRADEAVGIFRGYVQNNKDTMFMMAADSDAGGMQVIGYYRIDPTKPLPEKDDNGAPYDGTTGTKSLPFMSAPDKRGVRLPFVVSWGSKHDVSGAVLVRGDGLNSDLIRGNIDNTEIYNLMYFTLFGTSIKPPS